MTANGKTYGPTKVENGSAVFSNVPALPNGIKITATPTYQGKEGAPKDTTYTYAKPTPAKNNLTPGDVKIHYNIDNKPTGTITKATPNSTVYIIYPGNVTVPVHIGANGSATIPAPAQQLTQAGEIHIHDQKGDQKSAVLSTPFTPEVTVGKVLLHENYQNLPTATITNSVPNSTIQVTYPDKTVKSYPVGPDGSVNIPAISAPQLVKSPFIYQDIVGQTKGKPYPQDYTPQITYGSTSVSNSPKNKPTITLTGATQGSTVTVTYPGVNNTHQIKVPSNGDVTLPLSNVPLVKFGDIKIQAELNGFESPVNTYHYKPTASLGDLSISTTKTVLISTTGGAAGSTLVVKYPDGTSRHTVLDSQGNGTVTPPPGAQPTGKFTVTDEVEGASKTTVPQSFTASIALGKPVCSFVNGGHGLEVRLTGSTAGASLVVVWPNEKPVVFQGGKVKADGSLTAVIPEPASFKGGLTTIYVESNGAQSSEYQLNLPAPALSAFVIPNNNVNTNTDNNNNEKVSVFKRISRWFN